MGSDLQCKAIPVEDIVESIQWQSKKNGEVVCVPPAVSTEHFCLKKEI